MKENIADVFSTETASWPIDDARFIAAIALYHQTERKEHLDAVVVDYLLPLCQHRYVDCQYYRFDRDEAVSFAVLECIQRVLPACLRRKKKHTDEPIAGYDSSKISKRTGKRISAFAFFSTVAKRAFINLNREYTATSKAHTQMLTDAYDMLRGIAWSGDHIGLLTPKHDSEEEQQERSESASARYQSRVQMVSASAVNRRLLKIIQDHHAEAIDGGIIRVDVVARISRQKPSVVRSVLAHMRATGNRRTNKIGGEAA
jgi:hypothetical protein